MGLADDSVEAQRRFIHKMNLPPPPSDQRCTECGRWTDECDDPTACHAAYEARRADYFRRYPHGDPAFIEPDARERQLEQDKFNEEN